MLPPSSFMFSSLVAFLGLPAAITSLSAAATSAKHQRCRSQPGDPSFPTKQQLSEFNSTIGGRLVHVVPSAQFCKELPGGCSDAKWADSVFRSNIPGAMLNINWEQDYASDPPSLCFRNSSVCGQGSVPVYAVNATSATHIQAGVRFAQKHNLKVAIKASGHDYLGRSTAKNSLLLWTRYFEDITFHDSFKVGGKDKGSAVTAGSGVGLHTLYQATKSQGKVFVGGSAGNVVAAGGYVQGAGHSGLGPLLGLAADHALEFQVVLSNGDFVTANENSHPDLFWSLRGGGAGSWGVVISATFRTFSTFDIAVQNVVVTLNSTAAISQLATLHAQHIFDWDNIHASQYFFLNATAPPFMWGFFSLFPNSSIATMNASMAPFMDGVAAQGFDIVSVTVGLANANDILSPESNDGGGGTNTILGSRLIPTDVYRDDPTAVGEAYQKLLDAGALGILGHLVAGGRVSENANISSAVNPKWRSAKTHVVIVTGWADDTSPSEVENIRQDLTENVIPILDALAGPGGGSYSNEADVREPAFQTTFFGTNYARLSAIKEVYDPTELFIVPAGVGSEKWDADGLCRIS